MSTEVEITDEDRLKDRKVQVRLALAELRRAEKVLAQAEQDLLEFRFRDWEHFEVGDHVMIPRKVFGKIKWWPAEVTGLDLHFSEGDYRDGDHWETQYIGYRVKYQQSNGEWKPDYFRQQRRWRPMAHENTKERLIRLVNLHGIVPIAGIIDCIAAQELIDKDILRLASGKISPEGGSGRVTAGPRLKEMEEEDV